MERKIGEVFTYKGKTYKVVKTSACKDCAFKVRCEALESITGTCIPRERTDHTSVSFKLINNMEIKNNQLTIDIPEGMEIDLKNSDLAKGIVKFKKKDITYENVEDALKLGINCKYMLVNKNNVSKLVTLSKLMNIAKYYNGDWKPDWNNQDEYKYFIICNRGTYKVDHGWTSICSNIYFKNKEDAIAIINNPNFRDILDAIYKN